MDLIQFASITRVEASVPDAFDLYHKITFLLLFVERVWIDSFH